MIGLHHVQHIDRSTRSSSAIPDEESGILVADDIPTEDPNVVDYWESGCWSAGLFEETDARQSAVASC